MCDLSRVQLQRVFKNTALALSAVVEQLNLLAGLDATPFIPRGAEAGTAGTIDIAKLVAILAKVLVLVIGRDTTSLGRKARVEKLRAEFQDGVYMVTSHGETNLQVIQLPVYKARKAPLSRTISRIARPRFATRLYRLSLTTGTSHLGSTKCQEW